MLDLNFESSEKVRSVWSSTAITRFDISLPYVQIDTWIDFDLPNPIYMFFDSFLWSWSQWSDKPPFDPDNCDSSDRPDRTALCQRLIRPQSSLIICRRSWNGRGRLLRHFGERDDGEDRGNRKRRRLPFSVLPISHRIPKIRDDWGRVSVRGALL